MATNVCLGDPLLPTRVESAQSPQEKPIMDTNWAPLATKKSRISELPPKKNPIMATNFCLGHHLLTRVESAKYRNKKSNNGNQCLP